MKKSEELQNLIDNNNVYFYDKIREDKRIVRFAESYEVAEQLGWADNYVAISETEEGYDGVYLKGYAPVNTIYSPVITDKQIIIRAIFDCRILSIGNGRSEIFASRI